MRQLHLWLGAWGALAAVFYGITGLVMNHRFGEGAWPQGDSHERERVQLSVPQHAGTSAEAVSLWLAREHGLQAHVIRKGPPGGAKPGDPPAKWSFSGGTATRAWSVEYAPGSAQAQLKHTDHTWLAAFNRLHKAVGGWAWIALADSFAIAMTLLGLTGLWMWARGRNAREWALSIAALSALISLVVLAPLLA